MTRLSLPRLLVVTRDKTWYRKARQATTGIACPRRVGSLEQVDDALGAGVILVDGAAAPDVELPATWQHLQFRDTLIAVAAPVPDWRDAVTYLRSGVFDYFLKTYDVSELRRRLQRLLQISSFTEKVEEVDEPEAQTHSVCGEQASQD